MSTSSGAIERFDDKARESFESVGHTTIYRGELLRHPVVLAVGGYVAVRLLMLAAVVLTAHARGVHAARELIASLCKPHAGYRRGPGGRQSLCRRQWRPVRPSRAGPYPEAVQGRSPG